MSKPTSENWSGCPIRYGATVLGDAWALVILRDLIFKEAKHFGDFVAAGERISTNILTDRLKRLEDEGVITRRKDPDRAVRVIYELTEKGRRLVPVMLALINWSEAWDPQTEVPGDFIAAYRDDPGAFAEAIVEGLTPEGAPPK
ncbi:winged helix-turn-helix transcriptional regulator [Pseudooceanicola nitratireducens]|uniref:winged helix-turn-helix transcriptional regulator n=1 Tax=Pseudooceanicola nitratireducens TaxID=517719 RepID=UPI0023F18D9C|nr:helix-turn-helix domain-containing protein [Pseudooceanicola nitratireducens]